MGSLGALGGEMGAFAIRGRGSLSCSCSLDWMPLSLVLSSTPIVSRGLVGCGVCEGSSIYVLDPCW